MKLVLTLTFFCFLQGLFSQPIVDGSNYTTASSTLYFNTASPAWLAGLDLEAETGENLTWDFSLFQGLGEQVENFVEVSETPFLYQIYFNNAFLFPNTVATHAQSLGADLPDAELPINVSEAYGFFRNDASGYCIVGSAFSIEGLPLSTPYDTIDRVLTFPLAFGNQDSSRSYFLSEIPFLGTFGQAARRYTDVDAWGSLVTPDTTYEVLRVRTERYITDTLYIEQLGLGQIIERPLQVDYAFISPGADGPIFEASAIEGQLISGRIRTVGSTLSTGSAIDASGLRLYPNPAAKTFRVAGLQGKGELSILSLRGEVIRSRQVSFSNPDVDITDLPNGVYMVELITAKSRIIKRMVVAQ
jgi:hypothetical protein